jgi:hypothetical protein
VKILNNVPEILEGTTPIVFACLAFLVFAGTSGANWNNPEHVLLIKALPPLEVSLSWEGNISLNETFGLIFSLTPLIDAPQTEVRFVIPQEFDVVEGLTSWHGSMHKNETKEFRVDLRPISTGVWKLGALANIYVSGGIYSKADVVFIRLDEKSSDVSASMAEHNVWKNNLANKYIAKLPLIRKFTQLPKLMLEALKLGAILNIRMLCTILRQNRFS